MRFPSLLDPSKFRFRLHGKRITVFRRAIAVALLMLSALLALHPGSATPAPAESGRSRAGPGITLPGGSGLSTVPVHLADASVAQLLTSGMRVDVVTAESTERSGKVLASMATIVDIRAPPEGSRKFSDTGDKGPLVLIAVPTELATQIAAMSLRNPVAVTLR
jgi:hypothetical protein